MSTKVENDRNQRRISGVEILVSPPTGLPTATEAIQSGADDME